MVTKIRRTNRWCVIRPSGYVDSMHVNMLRAEAELFDCRKRYGDYGQGYYIEERCV